MAFSGLTLHYAIKDLNAFLPARIQKIQVLSYDQFIFHLYHKKAFKLYLNLSPSDAKIHRSELEFSVSTEPTVFVNRLKKWLLNATLMPFQQVSKDRIISADIKTKNELFDKVTLRLNLEFFGKDANLILTGENDTIIDCLKTSGSLFSHPRFIQIGAKYLLPEVSKNDPFDKKAVTDFFKNPSSMTSYFDGFSTTIAASLSDYSDASSFIYALENPFFYQGYQTPVFEKLDAPSIDFQSWADHLLKDRLTQRPYDQKRVQIKKKLNKRLERALRKKTLLHAELASLPLADELIIEGQGLMASPHKNDKLNTIEIIDYSENKTITLHLDPTKTVLENAQLKFKKAKKIKASVPHITKQLTLNEEDIQYYELLLYQLEEATQDSLSGLFDELSSKRIINLKSPSKPKKRTIKTVETSLKNLIYIGLNNEQNAYLTHEKAKSYEYWAHVRGYPGSHVILATASPTEEEMIEACECAAYFSKAKELIEVDVDITEVKHVKKIPGQHGCFVRYDHAKTFSVRPENYEKRLN